jgi:3-dehydroquinate dehydratase type I
MGNPPRICVPIISESQVISPAGQLADLYEVRIDLIGKNWRNTARQLTKPWLACNRRVEEGGKWQGSEEKRTKELLSALDIGAQLIDIELGTPAVGDIVKEVKGCAGVIISYHNLHETPPIDRLRQIIINELAAGAEICKVVTTARRMKDNVEVLELIPLFPDTRIISFAMGMMGQISRVMCPLVGGYMTWGSTEEGSESAEGQMAADYLRRIYRAVKTD